MRDRTRRLPLTAAILALGCAAHPRRPAAVLDPTRAALRVTVTLGADTALTRRASGRVAVAWLTPGEARDHAAGRLDLRATVDVLSRFCVAGDADLEAPGAAAACTLDLAPGTYVALAMLDGRGEFLETLLGGGGDGNLTGVSDAPVVVRAGEARETTVTLRRVVHADAPAEHCVGARTELVRVPSPNTAGRMGNAATRRLCVHLPNDYASNTARRYPVLWALPGLSGTDTSGFVRMVSDAVDASGDAAIVVGVDTSTRLGSSYLVDAPTNGAWEAYVTREAFAAIDGAYRTRPDAAGRALLGQSTGGFNAVSLAMRHPEQFSTVAASAPDALEFAEWFLDETGQRARSRWLGWMRLEDAMFGVGQWTSYAVDWSPNAASPRGFEWPVDLATGALRPAVWARWLAHTPAVMLDDPAVRSAVRAHLAGRIYLTAGRRDEADLFAPTERFSARLRALDIEHTFVATDEGHFPTTTRVRAMVEFVLRALRPARGP